MISLEKAKKLKEAGLGWEPQIGDMFYWQNGKDWGIVIDVSGGDWWAVFPPDGKEVAFCIEEADGFVSARRLDQLLEEIEKRGYSWEMRTVIDESQSVRFNAKNIAYWIHVWKTGHIEWEDGFKRTFTSPSNAAASALLWIYEGRAKA